MSSGTLTLVARVLITIVFLAFYGVITIRVLDRLEALPDGIKDVAMVLVGALTASVVTIIAFWFNSSQSSASKDATIAEAVRK